MEVWQIWGIAGIILIIVEMFTPALFFLNLALAAIITGIAAFYHEFSVTGQVIIFAVASILLLAFLRPLLLKSTEERGQTGVEAIYYGQIAKVTKSITKEGGRIAIFGEAWDAKSANGEEIKEDESVKIISCKGLTMIVEKV